MLNVESAAALVEEMTRHVFANKLLCAEAVQMASPQTVVIYNSILGVNNNKRLSILGDAVLAKVLCAAWFKARDSSGKTRSTFLGP
jgi:ribonuclease-3